MDRIIGDGIKEVLQHLSRDNISFKDKKVLVAGGAGFLGSWLCDVLIAQDAVAVSLDNYSTGRRENINHLKDHKRLITLEGDVSNYEFNGFPKRVDFDFILHFASPAAPPTFETNPIDILLANTVGTFRLLSLVKKNDAKMIFASTSEIYGNPSHDHPISEDYNGNVNPIGIRGCYDEAKRAGEAFVKAFERQYGVQGVILRLFNTYGPRIPEGRVVPNFVKAALTECPLPIYGDGTQTRSFAYVTDIIEGILRAAAFSSTNGETINLGNDNEISIQALARTFDYLDEKKINWGYFPLPADDPARRCPNIQKARDLLRWEPKVELIDGLTKTIEWFSGQIRK